jgi:hypothetical protein
MEWLDRIKYVGIGVAVVATVPILIGFGTAGIGAGTVAAGLQATIGNVAAGSSFATITSWGMSGYFVTTAIGGAATAGATQVVQAVVPKKSGPENLI